MYTCVVLIEAWPSSSCTARMSAPWSSMWVAQEWRSTWGLSCALEARPAAPCRRSTSHAPWRVSRPPRALRNTASASPRRRHCSGASARPALGPEPRHERPDGAARRAARPAPCSPCRTPGAARRRGRRRRATARPAPRCAARCRRAPRAWPGRAAPTGPSPTGRVEQAPDLLLGERLRQAPRHPGQLDVGAGIGGGAALVGEEPVQRAHRHQRRGPPTPGARPALAERARRTSTRSASVTSASGRALAAQPGRRRRGGRAGRRRWCSGARPRSARQPREELLDLERQAASGRRSAIGVGRPSPAPGREREPDDRLGVGDAARRRSSRRASASGTRSTVMAAPRRPAGRRAPRSRSRAEEQRRSSRRDSPGELWNVASCSSAAGRQAHLLGQLARRP